MEFAAGPTPSRLWLIPLIVLPMLIGLGGVYVLLAPPSLAYRVGPDALVVDAHLGVIDQGRTIPRGDISDAHAARVTSARRTMGTGLPGYCQGRWDLGGIGTAWIATDCRPDVVVVETKDGTVVVSPPDRDAFLAVLADPAGVGGFPVPARPRDHSLEACAVFLAAGLSSLVGAFGRMYRRLKYKVVGDVLRVPRHFGELEVPLRGTRVHRGSLTGALRIGGSALPGYYLGAFRMRGQGLHVAATRRTGGFIVEGPRRVYVTPEDSAGFLAAVARAGAIVEPAPSA
jgi:hypothetical protein